MAKFRDLSKSNTDLSDRSAGDKLRHRQAIKAALRDNLPAVINELNIFKKDLRRGNKYRISVKLMEEYKFVYKNNDEEEKVGQSTQKTGDTIGKKKGVKSAAGQKAGTSPGETILELMPEDIDFILDLVSKDLGLPNLNPKKSQRVDIRAEGRWRGIKENGIEPRFDLESSFVEKIKRQQMLRGHPSRLKGSDPAESQRIKDHLSKRPFPFVSDDLRYHGLGIKKTKRSNAVIVAIMDISGSMGSDKKYFAKAFLYALFCLIHSKFKQAEMVFIAHHTEAFETDPDSFFKLSESGGTKISSGPLKALEIIKEKYKPGLWNIYVVHCSDGENDSNDDGATVSVFRKLVSIANLVGFIEIQPGTSRELSQTSVGLLKSIKEPHFKSLLITNRAEVGEAFNTFMRDDRNGRRH